jgi:hypothetical protein
VTELVRVRRYHSPTAPRMPPSRCSRVYGKPEERCCAAAVRRHVTPGWGCHRGTTFHSRNDCGCSHFRRARFRKFPAGNLRLPESNLRARFDLAEVSRFFAATSMDPKARWAGDDARADPGRGHDPGSDLNPFGGDHAQRFDSAAPRYPCPHQSDPSLLF